MDLVRCPDCGERRSPNAGYCPHCHHDFGGVESLVALVITVLLILMVV